MRQQRQSHASSLFLLELILALLIFSVAGAVCVRFFVKAHTISSDSRILNHAVNVCASAAETVDGSDSAETALALLSAEYPTARISNTKDFIRFEVGFDGNFLVTESGPDYGTLSILMRETHEMLTADISFRSAKDTGSVYSLRVSRHVQRRTVP